MHMSPDAMCCALSNEIEGMATSETRRNFRIISCCVVPLAWAHNPVGEFAIRIQHRWNDYYVTWK